MSGFDLDAFMSAQLSPREGQVDAAEAACFFAEGSEPVFIVRGLTGEEMYRVAQEQQSAGLRAAVAEAMAGQQRKEIVDALREAVGGGESLPDAMRIAISRLCHGAVEPRLDRDQAVRLFNVFPNVAVAAERKIVELSGLGPDVGKLAASTPTPASV